jgi:pyruvate dehydrogenase E1 component alpha subunit
VSVAFFSDGATNQGVFAECLNLAALWKLPVLFVCENNHYAATTTIEQGTARWDIRGRAESYGVPGSVVDGNDVFAVHGAAVDAVAALRGGSGPRFLECETYRMEPHCGIIPDDRRAGEREEWLARDPILVAKAHLEGLGLLDEKAFSAMQGVVQGIIDEAVRFAEESPFPDPLALHNKSWIVGEGVPA